MIINVDDQSNQTNALNCRGYHSKHVAPGYCPIKVDYVTMPGWKTPIVDCRKFDQLPENAQKYVKKIEELLGNALISDLYRGGGVIKIN